MIGKALIPVAGKGTRLMPLTSVVPKALFPLVDGGGRIKSVLHVICEQAMDAGANKIGVVVSPWQDEMIRRYFAVVERDFGRLPAGIEYIKQSSPKGFGDAVLQGRNFVGDEPFLLLLGDHIQLAENGRSPCSVQVAQAFEAANAVAMVGMQEISKDELSKVGAAKGVPIGQDLYRCSCIVEKPDMSTAREKLVTDGLARDTFLGHCGIYIFSPEIFDCIAQVSTTAQKRAKEVELADAQALLLKKYPERYYLYKIAGRAYDLGTPGGYAHAQTVFRSRS
ncbi:MAG: sugar phosphate nucleotidyltransferase [Planctomycetota bacterium]|jgi:UTP--glucose-1-phosphate uridylyltransferase